MNKKIISLFLVLGILILSSITYAQDSRVYRGDVVKVKDKIDVEERVDIKIIGLEKAITVVKRNETKIHLEQVLNRIEQKRKEQLQKLEELKIDSDGDKVTAKGKGRAKLFGFIPIQKEYRYRVSENGSVIREKRLSLIDIFSTEEGDVMQNV